MTANLFKQIRGRSCLLSQRGAQDVARLLLHRPTMLGGPDAELAFELLFQIPNSDAGHDNACYH